MPGLKEKILAYLASKGSATVDELAEKLGVDKREVERVVKELAAKRVVKYENGVVAPLLLEATA